MTTSHDTGVRAGEAAETATDQARQVASVAREEARNVAMEARSQARGLLHQATSEVQDQSRQQARRLADAIRTLGEDLNHMADRGESGMANELVRQVAGRARALSWQLESREPTDLLEDLKSYARSKPGTFLLGALAAGVVAGRLTRAAKEAQSGGGSGAVPGGSEEGMAGTGVTDDPSLRPSSGAVPPELGDVPGTATGTPLAGTSGAAGTAGTATTSGTTGPQTSMDRPTPNDPSGPSGDPTEPGGRA